MPWQLIYTSAPRGLLSGQSGFCTVARSGDLREALAQRLEQISSYHYLRVAEAAIAERNPTVCAFRILDLRGSKYYVLTRIQPCGLDFTARTNHLAHHLVFQPNDLAQLPSPAAILKNWTGWLSAWQGEPRILEDPSLESFGKAGKSFLPAQTWLRVTGDSGRAAGLLEGECATGCYLVCPSDGEKQVLEMFCESLQLLNLNGQFPLRPWRHPFTTFLQAEDNPSDFHWRACQADTPAYQQAAQGSATLLPLRSVRAPGNSLAKVAREGQKPPAPPASEAPPKTKLSLQQAEGRKAAGAALADWQKPIPIPQESPRVRISGQLKSAALIRVAVVATLVLGLLVMKFWLTKRHAQQTAAPPVAAVHPNTATVLPMGRYQTRPGTLDLTQLDCLSNDGPTFVIITADFESFTLPIDTISPLQNLINRFDKLATLPNVIQLSLATNQWDCRNETRLNVHGRTEPSLSADGAGGMSCSLDYASWNNDHHDPVKVHASFAAPPAAFSLRFGFSSSGDGEPFRLLVVNESNPPPPLPLSIKWLKAGHNSVSASLQPPLGERLFGNVILPRNGSWQLLPFVRDAETGPARCLYKDWPADDLPQAGDELDFITVKNTLIARRAPFDSDSASQAQTIDARIMQAGLDVPLGKDIGIRDEKFESLAVFAPKAGPDDFIGYLNALKRKSGNKNWQRVNSDDDPADREGKFQQIYDLCVEKFPAAKGDLTFGSTNYFSAVWKNLNSIEKLRQEHQRLQDKIDKLQARLASVPETLDKAAYVGLFIIDPPGPGLEMIRFEGQ